MPQVIGEIKIDFDVIQSTVQTLWIGDSSDWAYSEALPANILITLPGSKKPFVFSFKKKAIASFNSHNLGITCFTNDCNKEVYANLPDGVYTICLKSGYSGFEKTKYYLKTDSAELELSKAIIKHGFEYSKNDKKFREKVYDIDWLIKVAKANAKVGDIVKADRFFSEAKSILKEFGECLDCI